MAFDLKKRAETGALGNNCSFHCVAHFLCSELEKGSDSVLTKQYQNNGYKNFLKKFGEHYKISPVTPLFLKTLVILYPNPLDREAIFGVVLRRMLGDYLKERGATMVDISLFQSDVAEYLKSNKYNSYLITPNKTWLDQNKERLQKMNSEDLNNELSEFFQLNGYYNFADYMSNPTLGATISPEELSYLTRAFNIPLKVYASTDSKNLPFFPNQEDKNKNARLLTVYNKAKHWEYEAETPEIAAQHNKSYKIVDELKKLQENISATEKDYINLAKQTGATFWMMYVPNSGNKGENEISTAIQQEFNDFKPPEEKTRVETKDKPDLKDKKEVKTNLDVKDKKEVKSDAPKPPVKPPSGQTFQTQLNLQKRLALEAERAKREREKKLPGGKPGSKS